VSVFASRLSPVHTDVVAHYPDLADLRRSVKSGDWSGVTAYFAGLPARCDQSVAVRSVAGLAGAERFLQRVVDAERDSSLARTLLGARYVVMAWAARGMAFAQYVSAAQARIFVDYLQRAERVLADAVGIDPANAAAWTERVTVARGLSLGLPESHRRYERAAEYCDAPYTAQAQLIQNLCPKWGGSLRELHAFTRACASSSQPGSLSAATVAHAHVEHAFTRGTGEVYDDYYRRREVRDELVGAAIHSVRHEDYQPVHGWVAAHSVFAFALFRGGWFASATPHFETLGRRAHPYGWQYASLTWRLDFLRARRAVRQR